MIEVEHVTKSFGRQLVLNDVSFSVQPGQVYGLIGYNGVGKTTLLKIISGIYRPDKGHIKNAGQIAYENPTVKKKCFLMTEEVTFFPQATLEDMRKFYRGYYHTWSDEVYQQLLQVFGIPKDIRISSFSKGMQRQAGLILAFSTGVTTLFLDEAFDGLDYSMRCLMKEMIRGYVKIRNAMILISSHNLQELEDLADCIGMLNNGELIFDNTTTYMRQQYQRCSFQTEEEEQIRACARLIHLETEENGWSCIIKGTKEQAFELLEQMNVSNIQVRPIRLEEFFEVERNVKHVDWEKVFRADRNQA